MEKITLDKVEFQLKEYHDFKWVHKYGEVFYVFDQTGSGCIGLGVENGDKRYFVKTAGVNTLEAELNPEESVKTLKEAVKLYEILRHPNLINMLEHFSMGDMYVVVFDWAKGECLFDHWNFDFYAENPQIKSPSKKYRELPVEKRLESVNVLFSFLNLVAEKNYVGVDFYDGSIIYDFNTDITTICDIDFFREKPTINDMGEDYWGSKRLKAPEEYILNETIDERTNVFTLGAMMFHIFGSFTEEEIRRRYKSCCFLPCSIEQWELSEKAYEVLRKAVAPKPEERYQTMREFQERWNFFVDKTTQFGGYIF
jgi:serine/threonine-protein kinase